MQSAEEECRLHPDLFQEFVTEARLASLCPPAIEFLPLPHSVLSRKLALYTSPQPFAHRFSKPPHLPPSLSESDLEELLTFYTQKKRSASVFLGTRYGSSGGHADATEGPSRMGELIGPSP